MAVPSGAKVLPGAVGESWIGFAPLGLGKFGLPAVLPEFGVVSGKQLRARVRTCSLGSSWITGNCRATSFRKCPLPVVFTKKS